MRDKRKEYKMTPKEKKSEEKNIKEEKSEKSEKRQIVIPGEVIEKSDDFLPGDGTQKTDKRIIANRFGLAEKSGRLIKIIPLSGIYSPRRGNVVIGRIEDITFNGWIINIDAPYSSFLPLSECPRYINRNDLEDFAGIGEMMAAKVSGVKAKGIDLTIKGRGLGKLEDGMIIKINSNKVPRVIGREGSMIKIIKDETGCNITVGQNGVIWIKGDKIEDELLAKESIKFITEKSFIEGLTDKIKDWFKKNKESKKGEKQ